MFVVVLILGLLAIAAGAAATVFGLSIKEFSFGGTVLIMGTIAWVGGMVMIGIAGAIRQLRRIAEAVSRQPVRLPRPAEAYEALGSGTRVPPSAARVPPPMPPMPPRSEPAQPAQPSSAHRDPVTETAVAAAAASALSTAQLSPGEPGPRPSAEPPDAFAASEPPPVAPAPEPLDVDEREAIPLSPHEPQFDLDLGLPPREPPDSEEPPPSPEAAAPPSEPEAELPPVEPAEPPKVVDSPPSPFDAIWPKHEPPAARESDAADRSAAPPFDDDQMPDEDTVPVLPEEAPPASAEPETAVPPPHPVSILKSGVVDGMAYTLYSDGAIEAELPTGTIRFASINELRAHLARTD
jgi:hypothetical protein